MMTKRCGLTPEQLAEMAGYGIAVETVFPLEHGHADARARAGVQMVAHAS